MQNCFLRGRRPTGQGTDPGISVCSPSSATFYRNEQARLYAEVPPPPRNERSAWSIQPLLQQWGASTWDARESSVMKEYRLEAELQIL